VKPAIAGGIHLLKPFKFKADKVSINDWMPLQSKEAAAS